MTAGPGPTSTTSANSAEVDQPAFPRPVDEPAPEEPRFWFARLPDWYSQWLAPTIERRLDAAGTGTLTWCPTWWAHPEAVARLEALWRAWEVCRDLDGEAPSRWFWQHADPNLVILMDAKLGPFSDCSPAAHRRYTNAAHLPDQPAPDGYWGTTDLDHAESTDRAERRG